jgi:glycosyltransferase involved in cell wall biosynthesis
MRVAILHDYLNQYGGAERVLEVFLELFPKADLYTLLYDERRTGGRFKNRVTKTSFLDFKFVRGHHRLFLPFMPLAAEKLRGNGEYDLIISSSAGYAKGFGIQGKYHICYCHSPLRYAWEWNYMKDMPFSPWPLREALIRPILNYLRTWDKKAAENVNVFFANSNYIRDKIRVYYGRDAEVLYPPTDTSTFKYKAQEKSGGYLLMVGRLLYYKRFDLGIRASALLRKKLIIVGHGPEYKKLKAMADSRFVRFVEAPTDRDLSKLYNQADFLIFPQIEDFGLVAAEAQLCGLPIIAYDEGGSKDIIKSGKTGIFFKTPNPEALVKAIKDAEKITWDKEKIAEAGERFGKSAFICKFSKVLESLGFALDN